MNADHVRKVMTWAKQALGPSRPAAIGAVQPTPPADAPKLVRRPRPATAPVPAAGAPDTPCGYVRIPFMAKAADARPLQRTIRYAADRMGLSPFEAAMLATHLFEGIATEVGLGRVVRIPGFGVFGPWAYESKKDVTTAVQPRFYAARPFRLEVRNLCDPADAKNDALMRYQRSHHPSARPEKARARTSTAMEAWRVMLRADPAYVGRR
jgi:hypothetical protein